jgi:hypothetical protein
MTQQQSQASRWVPTYVGHLIFLLTLWEQPSTTQLIPKPAYWISQFHPPGYGLDDRAIEVRSSAEAKDFSSSLCPDWLWGPLSLLYNGYRGVLSPGIKRGRGVTLTTHPHLALRSSEELYLLSIQAPSWRVVGQL